MFKTAVFSGMILRMKAMVNGGIYGKQKLSGMRKKSFRNNKKN